MIAVEEGVAARSCRRRPPCDFGMPMGPIELADVVGLDVCKHVGRDHRRGARPHATRAAEAHRIAGGGQAARPQDRPRLLPWVDGKPSSRTGEATQLPAISPTA